MSNSDPYLNRTPLPIMIKTIHAPDAAPPGGHYAHATHAAGLVFVSGVLPVARDGTVLNGALADQVAAVLANIEAVLTAAGCERGDVAKATIYVTDIAAWPEVDHAWAQFFGAHRPARAVVPVPTLHHGCALEVELVAEAARKAGL